MHKIHYQVSFNAPETHLFEVVCTIAEPAPEGQIISMPAWLPGSYLIRDFARNVVTIRASNADGAIEIHKLNKHTWQCAASKSAIQIHYQIYAFDLSVRTAYLDLTRAYFNGSSLFMQVKGQEKYASSVTILAPASLSESWQVGTSMPALEIDAQGFGTYYAENYADLIDFPVEIGVLSIGEFTAAGVPHRMIISGKHSADLSKLCQDLKTLCEYHIAFFGEAPFTRYDFMLYAAGDHQYGGLEHKNSTSLICPRRWLPTASEQLNKSGYQDLLGLCSHEYFHAWHVKRVKPMAFDEPDLGTEAYTNLLWVFEGFTAYYDSLALVKAGLISQQDYLDDLAKSLTRYLNTPGREVQTLVDSSFDAWIKLYKPDENTPNSQMSYYLKGSLVALCLDLSLRKKSLSLDHVMQLLWQRHKTQAVAENAIEQLIIEVGGKSFKKILEQMLRTTEALPLEALFADFGVSFKLEIENNQNLAILSDVGFKLGGGNEAKVASVYHQSAAEKAGLAGGDTIIAIDHLKVDAKNVENMINRKPAGSNLTLHAFRRDELLVLDMQTEAAKPNLCKLAVQNKANKTQLDRLKHWLTSPN